MEVDQERLFFGRDQPRFVRTLKSFIGTSMSRLLIKPIVDGR